MSGMICRGCGANVTESLVDLGLQPLSNAYVTPAERDGPELFYPLHPKVCGNCFLVQLAEFASPERIFANYAYFSSYSTSWLEHCERHVTRSIERLGLGASSFVVEVASNDGYLLRSFVQRGIRALGIEPAENVAIVARASGIPTESCFFGAEEAARIATTHGLADLIVANNVLAHVPDIHDFVEGFRRILAPHGVATFEFPHLVCMLDDAQFDTIYHEHFSYLSLVALEPVFAAHDLHVIDVESLATHGGSLRLWVSHRTTSQTVLPSVDAMRRLERTRGLTEIATYHGFAERVRGIRDELVTFLVRERRAGKRVVAYGAAAKGNTLINYCGIRSDLIAFVVDRNPHKVGNSLPGSRLAICPVERLWDERPENILILPWNLSSEIVEQLADVRSWGGRFIVAIPNLTVVP